MLPMNSRYSPRRPNGPLLDAGVGSLPSAPTAAVPIARSLLASAPASDYSSRRSYSTTISRSTAVCTSPTSTFTPLATDFPPAPGIRSRMALTPWANPPPIAGTPGTSRVAGPAIFAPTPSAIVVWPRDPGRFRAAPPHSSRRACPMIDDAVASLAETGRVDHTFSRWHVPVTQRPRRIHTGAALPGRCT